MKTYKADEIDVLFFIIQNTNGTWSVEEVIKMFEYVDKELIEEVESELVKLNQAKNLH
jgi:hypothetical protein